MEYTNHGLNDEFKFQKRAEVVCLQALSQILVDILFSRKLLSSQSIDPFMVL